MTFTRICFLTAFAIAMTAAFFSIYGLAHIYSASFIAVIIMGIVLEAGKLVTVSALHRMWDILSIPLKAYMFTAIFGLMVLTSAGIFGYLSNAYQEDSLSLRDNATKIEMLQLDIAEYDKRLLSLDDAIKVATAEFLSSKETKISMLNAEREKLEARIAQMDADVSRVKANYITKRLELIQSYKPERDAATKRIAAIEGEIKQIKAQLKPTGELASISTEKATLTNKREVARQEVHKLTSEKLMIESHTGPIIYIAKAMDKDVDDAILWMTLLIIIVFDPLAVVLTLVGNIAVGKHEVKKREPETHTYTIDPNNLPVNVTENVVKEQEVDPEPEPSVPKQESEPKYEDFIFPRFTEGRGSLVTELPREPELTESEPEHSSEDIEEETSEEAIEEEIELLDEPRPSIDTEDKLQQQIDGNEYLNPNIRVEQDEIKKLDDLISTRTQQR